MRKKKKAFKEVWYGIILNGVELSDLYQTRRQAERVAKQHYGFATRIVKAKVTYEVAK